MVIHSDSYNEVIELKSLKLFIVFALLTSLACDRKSPFKEKLEVVTYSQFEEFVEATGYVTDAERYGWSIVQQDVFNYEKVRGAYWKYPDGINEVQSKNLPVTQVSFNDAMAYCEWSGTKLPSYDEYWSLIENDKRVVISNYNAPITEVTLVNTKGNVWEITSTKVGNEIRLAGGSLFCSEDVCNGTSQNRDLYVDVETGNIHIGFAVIR